MDKENLYSKVFSHTITNRTKLSRNLEKQLKSCGLSEEDGFKIIKRLLFEVRTDKITDKKEIKYRQNALMDLLASIKRSEASTLSWKRKNLEKHKKRYSAIFDKNFEKEEELLSDYLKHTEIKPKTVKRTVEEIRNTDNEFRVYRSPEKHNIYYLYEYVPKNTDFRSMEKYGNEPYLLPLKNHRKITRDILKYKDDKSEKVISEYNKELMNAIAVISEKYFEKVDRISLVPIPSSKTSKTPQTKKSVDKIEEWYKKGQAQKIFKFNKILDMEYNNILYRIRDTEKQKNKNREERFKDDRSIGCTKDHIPEEIGFIILDDITTSGATMGKAQKVLVEKGADEKNIIFLAIGETVWKNDLYKDSEGNLYLNKYIDWI